MLRVDKKGACRFAALQSSAGRLLLQRSGRSPDDISSIVLIDETNSYIRSDAILRIGQQLGMPLSVLAWLGLLVPKPLRDALYDQIANNRYNIFGRTAQCRLSSPKYTDRFLE